MNSIAVKFDRVNALVLKTRNYVNIKTLKISTLQYWTLAKGTHVLFGLKISMQ